MIPLKLQIKNFLSYGPELQTIDFGPHPLICLSGKNGHGKSALLDAITWALWGQARKVAGAVKADKGLVHLGQTHMLVIFDFELDGNMYRIKREYTLTYGKSIAQLEFGMLDKKTDNLIALTDKTIRATQAKIEQTLHLDFDAFVNSAFLRQGNANEFSQKSAKDRKEILANILGLHQYEIIRKRALEKIRTASNKKQALLAVHEKLTTELTKKNDFNTQLDQVNTQLKQIDQQEQADKKEQIELEQQHKALTTQQKKYELITFKLSTLTEQQTKQTQQLKKLVHTWRMVHKKRRNLTQHNTLEKQKRELVDTINKHQKSLQKQLELKEQYLHARETFQQLEQKYAQEQNKLLQKQQIVVERLKAEQTHNLHNKTTLEQKQKELAAELQHIANEIAALQETSPQKDYETILDRCEKQFEKRKEHYQKYIALGNMLYNELKNIAQKENLVCNKQDPSCPLCEQNLSASRRRFLTQQFDKKKQLLTHRCNRLSRVTKQLKQLLIAQHEEITALKKIREQHAVTTAKITQHKKRRDTVNQVQTACAKEIVTLEKEITIITEKKEKQQL